MENEDINGAKFFADAKVFLVLAFIGAVVLGVAFLSLFRMHARATVWGVIYFKVISLAVLGLYLGSGAVPGAAISGILIMVLAAFTAFVFWLWRYEIDLVGRLLPRERDGPAACRAVAREGPQRSILVAAR